MFVVGVTGGHTTANKSMGFSPAKTIRARHKCRDKGFAGELRRMQLASQLVMPPCRRQGSRPGLDRLRESHKVYGLPPLGAGALPQDERANAWSEK